MAELSSGVVALLDSVSRSSAPVCGCQEYSCLDRNPLHHCAYSRPQAKQAD